MTAWRPFTAADIGEHDTVRELGAASYVLGVDHGDEEVEITYETNHVALTVTLPLTMPVFILCGHEGVETNDVFLGDVVREALPPQRGPGPTRRLPNWAEVVGIETGSEGEVAALLVRDVEATFTSRAEGARRRERRIPAGPVQRRI